MWRVPGMMHRSGRNLQKGDKYKYIYRKFSDKGTPKNVPSSPPSSKTLEKKSFGGILPVVGISLVGAVVAGYYVTVNYGKEDIERALNCKLDPVFRVLDRFGLSTKEVKVDDERQFDDTPQDSIETTDSKVNTRDKNSETLENIEDSNKSNDKKASSPKDLHDDALEELAAELLADVDDNDTRNEFLVSIDQVAEVTTLLTKCREALKREEEKAAAMAAAANAISAAKRKEIEEKNIEKDSVEDTVVETSPQEESVKKDEQLAESAHEEAIPQSKSRFSEARQNAMDEVLLGMAKQTTALRDEAERNLVRNLEGMDENALRYRVAQLTTEFFERIKWEGIRQQQALQSAEEVLAKKYSDLLSQQENEMKLDSERRLFELEKSLREEARGEMEKLQIAQETRVHDALTKQERELIDKFEKRIEFERKEVSESLVDQHTLEVAMLKEHHVKQSLETQKDIKSVNAEISALFRLVNSEFEKTTVSSTAHALAAAVLLAEEALSKSTPAEGAVKALRKFSSSEPLVSEIVKMLPASASTNGIPVLDDIRVRFIVVREEARKAALAPEGTNPVVSQMIGTLLSYMSNKPKGNVEGDSVEAALSRIDYYLERNNLELALRETRNIKGYPRTLMSDWERMVHERLVTDLAIRSLRTVSALRHMDLA